MEEGGRTPLQQFRPGTRPSPATGLAKTYIRTRTSSQASATSWDWLGQAFLPWWTISPDGQQPTRAKGRGETGFRRPRDTPHAHWLVPQRAWRRSRSRSRNASPEMNKSAWSSVSRLNRSVGQSGWADSCAETRDAGRGGRGELRRRFPVWVVSVLRISRC